MKHSKHTPSYSTRVTRSKAYHQLPIEILPTDLLRDDIHPQQGGQDIPVRTMVWEDPSNPGRHAIESSSSHLGEDSSTAEKESCVRSDRQTRGPTHCKDIWILSEREKIPIKTNEYGQPINEHTSKLSNFLGTLIRQHGLLNGMDWRYVDKTIKDDIWEDVKKKKMPNGEDPPRAHIFLVTHTRKTGNPADDASAEIIIPSLAISRGKGPQACNQNNVEDVFLKSWTEVDIVVASGIVVSRDSEKKVGRVELGDFFCEVSIEIPIQPSAPLIRPYNYVKTIGDATGKTIAWLRTHVERKRTQR